MFEPGIYLVATPIGNLEDITLRALRVLRECDLIACEDTRHTQKLLNHFEIRKPVLSYHEHNEVQRGDELVARAAKGERIAVVSDAGMPGISDPGFRVVRSALTAGVQVFPVPGPAAFTTALIAGGLPADQFRFVGFLPPQKGARRTALEDLRPEPYTIVAYEAPHRILQMLEDVTAILGPEREVVVAREMTKVHEEFVRGTAASVGEELTRRDQVRGEITVLIGGSTVTSEPQMTDNWPARIRQLMEKEHLDEREALKTVAREAGVSKSEIYRQWQRESRRRPGVTAK